MAYSIPDTLAPFGSFPTHDDAYGKGGFHAVADVAEMNAIPANLRKAGMQAGVVANLTIYSLDADLVTWVRVTDVPLIVDTTYYVDPVGGDDSNTGLVGNPWKTLARISSEFDNRIIWNATITVLCVAGVYDVSAITADHWWAYPRPKLIGSGALKVLGDQRLVAGFTWAHNCISALDFGTGTGTGIVGLTGVDSLSSASGETEVRVDLTTTGSTAVVEPLPGSVGGYVAGDKMFVAVGINMYIGTLTGITENAPSDYCIFEFDKTAWTDRDGTPVTEATVGIAGINTDKSCIMAIPDREIYSNQTLTATRSGILLAGFMGARALQGFHCNFRDVVGNDTYTLYGLNALNVVHDSSIDIFTDLDAPVRNMMVSLPDNSTRGYGFTMRNTSAYLMAWCSVINGAVMFYMPEGNASLYFCTGWGHETNTFAAFNTSNTEYGLYYSCNSLHISGDGFSISGRRFILLYCTVLGTKTQECFDLDKVDQLSMQECYGDGLEPGFNTMIVREVQNAIIGRGAAPAIRVNTFIGGTIGCIFIRYCGVIQLTSMDLQVPTGAVGVYAIFTPVVKSDSSLVNIAPKGAATNTTAYYAEGGTYIIADGSVRTTDNDADIDSLNKYGNNGGFVRVDSDPKYDSRTKFQADISQLGFPASFGDAVDEDGILVAPPDWYRYTGTFPATSGGSPSLARVSAQTGERLGYIVNAPADNEFTVDNGLFAAYTVQPPRRADINNAAWVASRVVKTQSGLYSRLADIEFITLTASDPGSGSVSHRIQNSGFSLTIADKYYVLASVKKDTSSLVKIGVREGTAGASIHEFEFNFDTGLASLVAAAISDIDITDCGNGEYLIRFLFTAAATNASHQIIFELLDAGGNSNFVAAGEAVHVAYVGGTVNSNFHLPPAFPTPETSSSYVVDNSFESVTLAARDGAGWLLAVVRWNHLNADIRANETIIRFTKTGEHKYMDRTSTLMRWITYKGGSPSIVSTSDAVLLSKLDKQKVACFLSYGPSGRRGAFMTEDGYTVWFSDTIDHTPVAAEAITDLFSGTYGAGEILDGTSLFYATGQSSDVLSQSESFQIIDAAMNAVVQAGF